MAKGDWWFKFEIPAWRNSPELRRCSLETRGFWIDCIAIMRDTGTAIIKGTYDEIARAVGCFPDEAERCITELRRHKTADVTQMNGNVTLKSRRYARELKVKEQTRLRVRKLRSNADVTLVKRLSERSNKKEVIRKEEVREEPPQASSPKKATRIPEPFLLTSEMRTWAKDRRSEIDAQLETEKFVNYWRAKPGRDGTKLDWEATWKNWILNAKSGSAPFRPNHMVVDKQFTTQPIVSEPMPCRHCGDMYCLQLHREEVIQ